MKDFFRESCRDADGRNMTKKSLSLSLSLSLVVVVVVVVVSILLRTKSFVVSPSFLLWMKKEKNRGEKMENGKRSFDEFKNNNGFIF